MQPYLVSSPSFSPESVHSPLTPTGYATDPYWASPHWTNDAVSDDGRSPAIHDGASLSGDGPHRPYPTHESLDLGIPFGSMSIYAGPDQLTPLFDSDCKLPGDSPSIVVSSAFRNHEAKMFSPNYPLRQAAFEYENDSSPESSALFSGTHPLPLTRPEHPRRPLASPANIHASMSRRKKEAKYFCEREGCGQSFTAHHNLKHHIRAHDNIRPYDCPYKELGCDYAAGTPTVMKRHKNRCGRAKAGRGVRASDRRRGVTCLGVLGRIAWMDPRMEGYLYTRERYRTHGC
uniref:C2H2-type domain-containing protein n=1 Tax=Mycena chlorophos TaxID=658473 RepID=A0ABQ0LM75_MYCCL|nr:predicted protein [Mycena chlorophos]